MTTPRVGERLNAGLHRAFADDDRLFLLGEDVVDPYGGAFKITRGLSTAYPDRVLSTPLSENGLVGVANGLAMTGHPVIVEIMFGDFVGLAFDQILNLTAKSVSMYGCRFPMPVVIRCPVGGRRGYGPTHSQSPQKHFIGIPDLALYELSPFHDPARVVPALLARTMPSVLFEDKVLYTERMFPAGELDSRFEAAPVGDGDWVRLRRRGASGPSVVLMAPGGVGRRALVAADRLVTEAGLDAQVLVPLRLYPLDVEPVLDLLVAAAGVWVAEESTAGGTWGSEVASTVHELVWHRLARPVRSVSSADSIIPAATHLEAEVLLSADTIVAAVQAGMRASARTTADTATPAAVLPATGAPAATIADQAGPVAAPEPPDGIAVSVPKLNNNDDEYVLTAWAVADGHPVASGQAVADVETSKATEELIAGADGALRRLLPAGSACQPGDVIARIVPSSGAAGLSAAAQAEAGTRSPWPDTAPAAGSAVPDEAARDGAAPGGAARLHILSRAQRQVAEVVSISHREIPAAFVAARVRVDQALAAAARWSAESGAELTLVELVVVALGRLQPDFPLLFGSLRPDGTVLLSDTVSVGVTVDVGTGLSVPVLRDVADRRVDEVADALTELRMRALRGRLTEQDLTGGSIAVSVNTDEDITLVQPIIPPGMVCAVSLTGGYEQVMADRTGGFEVRRVVDIGLAHDHRVVNGREATAFLLALKALLEEPNELLRARG